MSTDSNALSDIWRYLDVYRQIRLMFVTIVYLMKYHEITYKKNYLYHKHT